MTEPTLQRIWESRQAISRRCGNDALKLVRFYQDQETKRGKARELKRRKAALRPRASPR